MVATFDIVTISCFAKMIIGYRICTNTHICFSGHFSCHIFTGLMDVMMLYEHWKFINCCCEIIW